MFYKLRNVLAVSAFLLASSLAAYGDDAPPVNYKDNVLPIFQARCNACHNNDKKKGGLALDTYGGTMAGGGSGSVVELGDPDNSRLYLLAAHEEEPVMPPGSPRIPDPELATLKAWIAAGAPEASGSVVAMKAKPKLDFKLDPSAIGKPAGEPAMPTGLATAPEIVSDRPNAMLALAASPWAPLVALGGYKQVLLYNTQTQRLCGVLPFPEGTIHSLRFSRDGGILLVAGGHAAQKGLAVAFDVKTGERLFEVGNEYDVALAADISPDRSLVALGGPSKVLRVYRTADGELAYECRKHTEWVTAVSFSPDGVLLASGDRNGGLLVWEADTGREFYDLRGHSAMITGLDWRLDSNVVASVSEDGTARLWEMQNGTQVKSWSAHGGGAESIAFAKDGRLLTAGRDRLAKLWDPNGTHLRDFEAFGDIATRVAVSFDDSTLIAGDWSGEVRLYKTDDGTRLVNLSANPLPLPARLEQAQRLLATAQAASDAVSAELAPLQAASAEKAALLAAAQAAFDTAQQQAAQAAQALASVKEVLASRDAAITTAQQALESASQARSRTAELLQASESSGPEAKAAATLALSAATTCEQALQAAQLAATASRDATAAPIAGLETAATTAAQAAEARKAELDAATQARTAADQALAEKTPSAQTAQNRAAALKAEVEALTTELQTASAAPVPNPEP